jgi:sugar phosphate permease
MPPTTAVLLNHVGRRDGIASGVFHTSRQVGGALAVAVAVFGSLVANPASFMHGVRISLTIAAAVALLAVVAALGLRPAGKAAP